MMRHYLPFEQDIEALDQRIAGLEGATSSETLASLEQLKKTCVETVSKVYDHLTPWEVVQVARHPQRPKSLQYIHALIENFEPLAGDRFFGEDQALIAGVGMFHHQSVAILAQEKGYDTESRLRHNFGMPRPEGYRKAQRVMELAQRFSMPVITFVDTSGADPGIEAEERGQAQSIAQSIKQMLFLKTPVIAIIIGEGGSGGALAIAVACKVFMMEYALYSVASPEAAAAILWRERKQYIATAKAMKITAPDLLAGGIIDGIIKEPIGGAHRDPIEAIRHVGETIKTHLALLKEKPIKTLQEERHKRFLKMDGRGI